MDDNIPDEVLVQAKEASSKLIPEKLRDQYYKELFAFNEWREKMAVAALKEDTSPPDENTSTVITSQPNGYNTMGDDWSPSVIRVIPYCPPGFEILRNMETIHLEELVRLSDENHYLAFDQHERKKRIFTLKGRDNWFAGESLSIFDAEKREILTASTTTKNMLQRVTMFCPPGHKVLLMEKDVHFCKSIKYTVKALNSEEIYNIASNQPSILIPYIQSRKYNVVDRDEVEVARMIVSSNICVTGDMIDLKFFVGLDVRLKAALLAATVIIHLASGVTTTKQAGI